MNTLDKDCCYIIWKFVGGNAIFLNKELIELLNLKRKSFIEKPLRLYYKLAKFKEIRNYSKKYIGRLPRPTIVVEKNTKYIDLSGSIPFGKLASCNKILPSEQLNNILVPIKKKVDIGGNRYFNYKFKLYYWEIFTIFCRKKDIKRAKIYELLFPSQNFQKTNILNVFYE